MNARPPSGIAAVAARAGVSIATVSRVVNGVANKASTETTARVWAAVRALDYRPISAGRALRSRQSRLVALLAANLANPAMTAVAASVETALRRQGLVMVLCDTHDRPDLQDEYLLEMRAQLVRATVLLGAVPSKALNALTEAGNTLLFVNRRHPASAQASFIGIDNLRAGGDVAAYLIGLGIADAGLIHASGSSSATAERVAGFAGAMRAAERTAASPDQDHMALGYRSALDVLPSRDGRRGIFCASDLIAYGAHRRLSEAGLRVPEDVVLVGFDDNPLNDWIAPWLTSVRVPYDEFGPATVTALAMMARGETVLTILPYQLIVR